MPPWVYIYRNYYDIRRDVKLLILHKVPYLNYRATEKDVQDFKISYLFK
jgi:hypothetical protein